MRAIEHPGARFEYKTFNDLLVGELFEAVTGSPAGTFIKVTDRTYSIPVTTGLMNGSPSLRAVNTMTGQPRFYSAPPVRMIGNPYVVEPSPSYRTIYYNTNGPSTPGAFPGVDPVLGFPYAPVDYQLFITAPDVFARTTNPNNVDGPGLSPNTGLPVALTWTVPDVNASPVNYRIYNVSGHSIFYAKRSAPVGPVSWTQILNGGSSSEHSSTLLNQYVAFRLTPTANPTINEFQIGPCSGDNVACPIHGGAQQGWTSPPHQLWPGASSTASVIIWDGRDANDQVPVSIQQATVKFKGPAPGDALHHFELSRSRGNSTFSDPTNSGIGPTSRAISDPADRDPNISYFYKLVGVTASGFRFDYNNVGVIRPYSLSVVTGSGGSTLTWTAPLPSEVTGWPTN